MKKLSSVFSGLAVLAGIGGGIYAIVIGINAQSFWLSLPCLCGAAVSVLFLVAMAKILKALDLTVDALDEIDSKVEALQATVSEERAPKDQASTPKPAADTTPKSSTTVDYFSAQIVCPSCKCVQSRYRSCCFNCGYSFTTNTEENGKETQ